MIISRTNRLRHKILQVLVSKFEDSEERTVDVRRSAVTTKDIAAQFNSSVKEIRAVTSHLILNKEIQFDYIGGQECMYAAENTYPAYVDRKYKNLSLDRAWKRAERVIFVGTFAVAIITAASQITSSTDIKELQQKVTQLEHSLSLLSQPQK